MTGGPWQRPAARASIGLVIQRHRTSFTTPARRRGMLYPGIRRHRPDVPVALDPAETAPAADSGALADPPTSQASKASKASMDHATR